MKNKTNKTNKATIKKIDREAIKAKLLAKIDDPEAQENVEEILDTVFDVVEDLRTDVEEVVEELETTVEELETTVEEIETTVEEISENEDVDEEVEEEKRKKIISVINKELNKFKEKWQPSTKTFTNVSDAVRKQIQANPQQLKALKEGRGKINLTLKAAGAMTFGNSISGQIPQAERIAGYNEIALRPVRFMETFTQVQTDKPDIEWVYEVVGEGEIAGTAEGEDKNLVDAGFNVGSEKIKKFTGFVKVSDEMVDDVEWMVGYITNQLLDRKLRVTLDEQVLKGNASTKQLNGAITQATAFDAGGSANTILEPNILDVIVMAQTQVEEAEHQATHVVLHPRDISELRLKKDDFGRYLFPELNNPIPTLSALTIISTTAISKGNFLVYDANKGTVYFREDVNVEVGFDGDDFRKNFRSFRAEARLAFVIETNDRVAFVKGAFNDAITALAAPAQA